MEHECLECGEMTDSRFKDDRVPPLDTDYCLCAECYIGVSEELLDEAISNLEQAVDDTNLHSSYDTRRDDHTD